MTNRKEVLLTKSNLMEEVIAGINDEELNSLSLEVLDRADMISEIFDKIDACMERLPACYQGEPCKRLLERYGALKSSYPIIKGNIVSYSDDFITLINKMHENDKYLSGLFQGYTNDISSQIKTDNFNLR